MVGYYSSGVKLPSTGGNNANEPIWKKLGDFLFFLPNRIYFFLPSTFYNIFFTKIFDYF